MPTRTIATRIAVEGEKEFARALKDAGREMRVLGSELKAAQAEFEVSGDRQAFLTEKSRALSGQLEQQREVVRALEANIAEMSKSWGEGSETADKFAIQLNNARAKASQLEKELNQTDKELDDLDDGMEDVSKESRTFGRSLERNVEEQAEDSEKAVRGLGQELLDMKSQLDDIRNLEGVQVGMDIAGGVWDAATALFDYAEQARDYNRQLAMLEVNAANAKIDYSVAEAEAFEAASYIGELDSALEGVNELLAAGLDTTQFTQSMDLLTGAAMRFPDTLKFESLADGLQETLATGQGAGQFAELLERLGVDIDAFNTGLADAKKSGDEVDYTLTYLSQHGLADSKRQFGEANKSMVEAEAATLRLEKAWYSFGEVIDPIATGAKNAGAFALETISEALTIIEKATSGPIKESAVELANAAALVAGTKPVEFDEKTQESIKTASDTEKPIFERVGAETDLWFGGVFRYGEQMWEDAWNLDTSIFKQDQKMITDYEEKLQEMEDAASDTGTAIPTDLGAALDEAAPIATASAQSLADEIQTILDSVAVPNYAAMMAAASSAGLGAFGSGGGATIVLNGRKVGQMLTPTISTMQARAAKGG